MSKRVSNKRGKGRKTHARSFSKTSKHDEQFCALRAWRRKTK